MQIIEGKVSKNSNMYTDGFPSHDDLVDRGCRHYYRVHCVESGLFGRDNPGDRINGIDNVWSFAENRLVKHQSIVKGVFHLHLKKCEFRFNMRSKDMDKFPLPELPKRPLN